MLGHKLYQVLSKKFDTYVTMRHKESEHKKFNIFNEKKVYFQISCKNLEVVEKVIKKNKPDVIINCIGIVKQIIDESNYTDTIYVNAIFPHKLKNICKENQIRLIHFSTDCVFSGKSRLYKESDMIDVNDVYGLSKYLGELNSEGCLTIRTSIIGRELCSSNGLLEWFMSNKGGNVKGYKNVIFSGLPTIVLSKIIMDILENFEKLSGLYHVSSKPINKYKLLKMINSQFSLDISIEPQTDYIMDRSLDSSLFQSSTGIVVPDWDELIELMEHDSPDLYIKWRNE